MSDPAIWSPPRQARHDGARTRASILTRAVELATVDGLEGLTIGRLASDLKMSKSGLYAHFGSKEQLQLATVEEAGRQFEAQVVASALKAPDGRNRLIAFVDSFLDYLARRQLPGGCFFAGAVLEMGTRPGPVRNAVAAFQTGFVHLLTRAAHVAVQLGELPGDEDVASLVMEINGLLLVADARFVMSNDDAVLDLARASIRRRLAPAVAMAADVVDTDDPGGRLVAAVAAKDAPALTELVDPAVVFMGLTPGRTWSGTGPAEVLDILFGHWFEDSDHIVQLDSAEFSEIGGVRRAGYRMTIDNPQGRHVVEQQAYYEIMDGRITRLRILCSGFRPIL